MSDPKDFIREKYIEDYSEKPNTINVGITWVDGRCIFNPTSKHANVWFGICHYSNKVWAIAPIDYDKITAIINVNISFTEEYCSKAHVCLNFMCTAKNPISGKQYRMNKFDRFLYVQDFKDVGFSSLGLRSDIGSKELWFNEKKYNWENLIKQYKPSGAVLRFNEYHK